MINSLSTKTIEKHVLGLVERMITGLQRIGLPVFASEPGLHRGHMVAIGDAIGNQHDATDNPAMQSLYQHLSDNNVRLTIRRGILRVSSHFYNNNDDVDRLVDVAEHWAKAEKI